MNTHSIAHQLALDSTLSAHPDLCAAVAHASGLALDHITENKILEFVIYVVQRCIDSQQPLLSESQARVLQESYLGDVIEQCRFATKVIGSENSGFISKLKDTFVLGTMKPYLKKVCTDNKARNDGAIKHILEDSNGTRGYLEEQILFALLARFYIEPHVRVKLNSLSEDELLTLVDVIGNINNRVNKLVQFATL